MGVLLSFDLLVFLGRAPGMSFDTARVVVVAAVGIRAQECYFWKA